MYSVQGLGKYSNFGRYGQNLIILYNSIYVTMSFNFMMIYMIKKNCYKLTCFDLRMHFTAIILTLYKQYITVFSIYILKQYFSMNATFILKF